MAMMKCPLCGKDMVNNLKATKMGTNEDKNVLLLRCPQCDGYLGAVRAD